MFEAILKKIGDILGRINIYVAILFFLGLFFSHTLMFLSGALLAVTPLLPLLGEFLDSLSKKL